MAPLKNKKRRGQKALFVKKYQNIFSDIFMSLNTWACEFPLELRRVAPEEIKLKGEGEFALTGLDKEAAWKGGLFMVNGLGGIGGRLICTWDGLEEAIRKHVAGIIACHEKEYGKIPDYLRDFTKEYFGGLVKRSLVEEYPENRALFHFNGPLGAQYTVYIDRVEIKFDEGGDVLVKKSIWDDKRFLGRKIALEIYNRFFWNIDLDPRYI